VTLLCYSSGREKWTVLRVAAVKDSHFFLKWAMEENKSSGHVCNEVDHQRGTALELGDQRQ
jgi:hypothetical protein